MKCIDCDIDLPLTVCRSAAGWYVGTWCPQCGPYSRESGYFRTERAAAEVVADITGKPVKVEDGTVYPDYRPEHTTLGEINAR